MNTKKIQLQYENEKKELIFNYIKNEKNQSVKIDIFSSFTISFKNENNYKNQNSLNQILKLKKDLYKLEKKYIKILYGNKGYISKEKDVFGISRIINL